IGFARPDPDGWSGILALLHVRDLVKVELLQPLYARLTGTPAKRGYSLGSFAALERDRPGLDEGRRIAAERLREIADAVQGIGARLVVLMVPAPGQVCDPHDFASWPRGGDLGAAGRCAPVSTQR